MFSIQTLHNKILFISLHIFKEIPVRKYSYFIFRIRGKFSIKLKFNTNFKKRIKCQRQIFPSTNEIFQNVIATISICHKFIRFLHVKN